MPLSRTSRRASRSTACTSTTRATPPSASTTAGAPCGVSRCVRPAARPPRCAVSSTRGKPEDPLVYRGRYPDEWKAFRISRLTALVAPAAHDGQDGTSGRARDSRNHAGHPEAHDHRLQDWAAWLQAGLVDAVCPMAYTQDVAALRRADRRGARRSRADRWSGLASAPIAFRRRRAVDNIETARRLGAAGVILFSYDSLIDPRQAQPDYMAVVGRSAFAKPAAGAAGTR